MVSRSTHLIVAVSLAMGLLLTLLAALPVLKVRADSLTVTNTNDSGPGSLRQAIADAADGDTIDFDGSLNGQTIILTGGELLITKNLTIDGPGPTLLAISGNNNSRVFLITSTVTISGVTIREGSDTVAGGISNNGGSVTLTNSAVSSNTATSGSGGGISNGGSFTLTNSTVSSNTALDNAPFPYASGGGIYNYGGAFTVANSSIFSNTATTFGGGIYNAPDDLNDSGGTLIMASSTVFSNTADYGGGITNAPGIPGGGGGTLTMTNSSVFGNIADIGGAGIVNGGTMTVDDSTVSSNTASTRGGGILHDSGGSGGSLNLSNSTITATLLAITAADLTSIVARPRSQTPFWPPTWWGLQQMIATSTLVRSPPAATTWCRSLMLRVSLPPPVISPTLIPAWPAGKQRRRYLDPRPTAWQPGHRPYSKWRQWLRHESYHRPVGYHPASMDSV